MKITRSNVLFEKKKKKMYMIVQLCTVSVMDQAAGKNTL